MSVRTIDLLEPIATAERLSRQPRDVSADLYAIILAFAACIIAIWSADFVESQRNRQPAAQTSSQSVGP